MWQQQGVVSPVPTPSQFLASKKFPELFAWENFSGVKAKEMCCIILPTLTSRFSTSESASASKASSSLASLLILFSGNETNGDD